MKKLQQTVNKFQDFTRDQYGHYGFAAGYLGAKLIHALSQLPTSATQEFVKEIDDYIAAHSKL